MRTLYVGTCVSAGTDWTNWALVAAFTLCLPVLGLFKERYARLDIDTVIVESEQDSTNPGDISSSKKPDLTNIQNSTIHI